MSQTEFIVNVIYTLAILNTTVNHHFPLYVSNYCWKHDENILNLWDEVATLLVKRGLNAKSKIGPFTDCNYYLYIEVKNPKATEWIYYEPFSDILNISIQMENWNEYVRQIMAMITALKLHDKNIAKEPSFIEYLRMKYDNYKFIKVD